MTNRDALRTDPVETERNRVVLRQDLLRNRELNDGELSTDYIVLRNSIYAREVFRPIGGPSNCMYCRRTYDANFFSSTQRRKSTHERKCKICIQLVERQIYIYRSDQAETDYDEEVEEDEDEGEDEDEDKEKVVIKEEPRRVIREEVAIKEETPRVSKRRYEEVEEVEDVTEQELMKRKKRKKQKENQALHLVLI